MNKQIVNDIFNKLMSGLPSYWDGRESILFMKENGCHNWRQMEWPGWFFQFMCETILSDNGFLAIPGPSYGNVEFDGFRSIPWDFKAHTSNCGSKVPTNGYQEVCSALEDYGQVGFIIATGDAIFDDENASFKKWHDSIKGKTTAYELERIERGAPSRRRKASFDLKAIEFIILNKETLQYCGSFQGGMRNSNGKARNPKVMLDLNDPRIEHYVFYVKEMVK